MWNFNLSVSLTNFLTIVILGIDTHALRNLPTYLLVENQSIRVYLSFIEHKNHEITCSSEVTFLVDLTLEIAYKSLNLDVIWDGSKKPTNRGYTFDIGSALVQ